MQSAFSNLPLFLKLMCIAALAMWVPALVCLVAEQHYQSRTFFYSGLLGLTFVTIMGITLSSRKSQGAGLSLLIDLGLVYFALPAFPCAARSANHHEHQLSERLFGHGRCIDHHRIACV